MAFTSAPIGWWMDFQHPHRLRQRRTSWLAQRMVDGSANAMLAMYYARRGNPEVVYTPVGDGHISIPLSVGIYTLYRTIQVPAFSTPGLRF